MVLPRRSPDWDALAPYWEHFEDGGLDQKALAEIAPLVQAPLLYVGSGRGGLVAGLTRRFGRAAVHSVDRSTAMCQRAKQDHGIISLAADAAQLPFPDSGFATVLCATGVVEYLDHNGRTRVLAELGRVCRPGGQVIAWAACGDNGVHWETDQHALVRAWFAGRFDDRPAAVSAFNAVATAMGDRARAQALLLAGLPQRGRAVSAAEVAAAAADAGIDVVRSHVDNDGIGRWHLTPTRSERLADRVLSRPAPGRPVSSGSPRPADGRSSPA
jgi:SAM-dependent methyltransferase